MLTWNEVEKHWKESKGKIKAKWPKLTDHDLDEVGGKRALFITKLENRQGIPKAKAEKEIDEFLKTLPKFATTK